MKRRFLLPTPGMNLHECQKKGLTEKAFRKLLILKYATLGCLGLAKAEMGGLKKKSGSKLPHSKRGFIQD
jgi:hypothetical protein